MKIQLKKMEYIQYNNDENPTKKWNKYSTTIMKIKLETNGIHAVKE